MGEITEYKNEMNVVTFKDFTAKELDLFFAIVTRMKNQGLATVQFSFDDLNELSQNNNNQNLKRFKNDLEKTYRKMLSVTCDFENKEQDEKTFFVLFTKFKISGKDRFVEISVNPEFEYMLNDLTGYTRFEIDEFTSLRSVYAKNMYRLLKQWRTVGEKKFTLEELRKLLDIPNSYDWKAIKARVLKPIEQELSECFKLLSIEKKRTGRTITSLIFTFAPEEKVPASYVKPIKTQTSSVDPEPKQLNLYNWLED